VKGFDLRAAIGVVLVVLLAYPLVAAWPLDLTFADRSECVVVAHPGDERKLEIVYGHFDDFAAADAVAEHARTIGYSNAVAVPDGCGRWKAINPQVDSYDGGADAVAEGERAGLPGRLEVTSG
jgi:hypothetical protein